MGTAWEKGTTPCKAPLPLDLRHTPAKCQVGRARGSILPVPGTLAIKEVQGGLGRGRE